MEVTTVIAPADRQMYEIASHIRRARRARAWTQAELAEQAGVAPGTVNAAENGRTVRPGNLRAVLDALGIQPQADETPEDAGIQLALDMVQQWLAAMEPVDRSEAIQALTRFTVLGAWRP